MSDKISGLGKCFVEDIRCHLVGREIGELYPVLCDLISREVIFYVDVLGNPQMYSNMRTCNFARCTYGPGK